MISIPTAHGTGVAWWTLIDTRTGRTLAADQTRSDPLAFDDECCGGEETTRVDRDGGPLIANPAGVIGIWYPRILSHPTVLVTP